ncbi:MAG: FAD-dependent oxidoreductase, partial [Natronospirillum sp.]
MRDASGSNDANNAPRWLIIGHGMVAMRFLQNIVDHRAKGVGIEAAITVVSAEQVGGYNRIGLSDVLVGKRTLDSLDPVAPDWFEQQGISVKYGAVVHIDRVAHRVVLASGEELAYDRLILATGSSPRVPGIPGIGLQGVQAFRTRNDLHNMKILPEGSTAVVLGGGLLGLEAAVGLAGQGVGVTVVHRGPWLMNRQLDKQAGDWLAARLEQQGITFITGAEAQAIAPQG